MPHLLGDPGGVASDDLNATVMDWPPGHEAPEHVNAERDVLLVVLRGSATVAVDGREHPRAAGEAILIERGAARPAASAGARVLTPHRRREGLMPSASSRRDMSGT
jgi:quercetin dioxygenase-like cupin family protein